MYVLSQVKVNSNTIRLRDLKHEQRERIYPSWKHIIKVLVLVVYIHPFLIYGSYYIPYVRTLIFNNSEEPSIGA